MNKASKPKLLYYQKLGELFYAIAASVKTIDKLEYAVLNQLVAKEWKNIDEKHDDFENDAAYQISIVFDWFDYKRMDADECFNSFKEYYQEHKQFFSEKRKTLILKTSQAILNAFCGINKSKKTTTAKLNLLFSNI